MECEETLSDKAQYAKDMPDAKPASILYRDYIKRWIDIGIALPALLVAAVPMAIIAVLIRLDSPGPVLFRQYRLGKDGRVYRMLKFRSMYVNAEHTGSGVYSDRNDSRVTRIGKLLRASSLDELPQLINVLKGDMSLLGPRPPLTYHPWSFAEYTEEQKCMFDVRPGFSGWAQLHGGRTVEWHHRIEMNVWYVNHVRFSLDCKLFFLTIVTLLRGKKCDENIGKTVITDPEKEINKKDT